jgi:lauroyl/myristoyl acyltransferase
VAAVLEQFIAGHPDQWLAFSPLWSHEEQGSTPATMSQQSKVANI